jgi:hypothetical protein
MKIWAIPLAGATHWILGAIWFRVFGKLWAREVGKRAADLNPKNPVPYLVALLGSCLTALGIAQFLWLLQVRDGMTAVGIGVTLWVMFGVAVAGKHYAFSGRSLLLFLLDYGQELIGFAAMALILWRLS